MIVANKGNNFIIAYHIKINFYQGKFLNFIQKNTKRIRLILEKNIFRCLQTYNCRNGYLF